MNTPPAVNPPEMHQKRVFYSDGVNVHSDVFEGAVAFLKGF
ncbi:hypothetical protein AD44_4506 [Escherichia coli 3-373-03_S4_C3]|nr:hypothetical protein AD17_4879 [Escherichia coli 3-373-03_S4_C2]KDU28102.1 hypothetical protein AD17_4619 [Escherichia coli 3-373-03_S4_C2]KEL21563.1 hypothetical protein AD44_4506 [Escherichia coli 3-373-03_S4_C3]